MNSLRRINFLRLLKDADVIYRMSRKATIDRINHEFAIANNRFQQHLQPFLTTKNIIIHVPDEIVVKIRRGVELSDDSTPCR
jgi:hypothetical protein